MTARPGDTTGGRGKGTILFGGSGLLGSYILERYPQIVSVGRTPPRAPNRHIQVPSLADLDVLNDVEFDKVIYIVGNTDRYNLEKRVVPRGEPNAFDHHLFPLVQTLEQLKERPLTKFIHFSTILIYDEKRITLPVSEHAPIAPYRNRYVASKYLAEEACKFYAQWVPIINVRMSNLYGPTPLRRYDLIHRLCRQLLDEGRSEIWSRKPERDFIYVADAAQAVVRLLEADYAGTLNLGAGEMTPVGAIVDALMDVSGYPITELDRPVEGPMQFQCDMTTLRRLIDWSPSVSPVEGARRTYQTMKAYREQGLLQ